MNLRKYGFEQVGQCNKDPDLKHRVRFEVNEHPFTEEKVIYAFVVNNKARYVGICQGEKTDLRERMKRYQGRMGGGANERISKEILKSLKKRKSVKIFALIPKWKSTYQYKGLRIDLVRGLESSFIAKLGPDRWNKQK